MTADVEEALFELFESNGGFSTNVLSSIFPLKEILSNVMGENFTEVALPQYRPYFFSEAVNPLSESDMLTPVGLAWYPAQRDSDAKLAQWHPATSRSLVTMFLCAECDSDANPCLNGGVCSTEKVCECSGFFSGSMCEQTVGCHEAGYCLNNGTCPDFREYCICTGDYFGSLCQYKRMSSAEYVVNI